MGFLGTAQEWGGGGERQKVSLSLQTVIYPTMMRLRTLIPYLKKIQKTYEPRDTTLEISIFFHQKSAKFATPRNTDI